jgi:hypothetical protein
MVKGKTPSLSIGSGHALDVLFMLQPAIRDRRRTDMRLRSVVLSNVPSLCDALPLHHARTRGMNWTMARQKRNLTL